MRLGKLRILNYMASRWSRRCMVWGLLITVGFIQVGGVNTVKATEGCTGSVSPSSVLANNETAFTFTVTNTGSSSIGFVQLNTPSSNFTLVNYGVSGWSVNSYLSWAEIYDGVILPGDTFNFTMGVNTGISESSSADWSIQAGGNNATIFCTGGPFGTAISGMADAVPPVLSGPTISGVTDKSAIISWTTNEPAESYLQFGKKYNEYETTLHNQEKTMNHSFTLSNLSQNTTYWFAYRSVDSSGNSSQLVDFYSFTTSVLTESSDSVQASGPTIMPQKSQSMSNSGQAQLPILPMPSPTPIPDRSPPQVAWITKTVPPSDTAPSLEVSIRDNGVVRSLDYSIDDGLSWRKITFFSGRGSSTARAIFTPDIVFDDNYFVRVRAIDGGGNVGISPPLIVVFDTLPPLLSPILVFWNQQQVPVTQAEFRVISGLEYMILVNSVGGAVEIKALIQKVGNETEEELSFTKSGIRGVWKMDKTFENGGEYRLQLTSIDGAGNMSELLLPPFLVSEPLLIKNENALNLEGLEVRVYKYRSRMGGFELTQQVSLAQEDTAGFSQLPLTIWISDGDYYWEMARGKRIIYRSEIATQTNPGFLKGVVNIARQNFWLPYFNEKIVAWYEPDSILADILLPKDTIQDAIPTFTLTGASGQVLSSELLSARATYLFTLPWMRDLGKQLSWVGENQPVAKLVLVQANRELTNVLLTSAGHTLPFYTDPVGGSAQALGLKQLPAYVTFSPGASSYSIEYIEPQN